MPRQSSQLGSVVRRLGELVEKPVEIGDGTEADRHEGRLLMAKGRVVPIRCKRLAATSRYLVESAILHHAAVNRLGERGVLVLSVPRLMPQSLDRIHDLLQPLGTDADWAIIADAGGYRLHLRSLGIERERQDATNGWDGATRGARRLDFSEGVAWIVKVLLFARLPASNGWWSGPRGEIRTGTELARVAGVSSSRAYQVLELLRHRSWLRPGRAGAPLTIASPRALLSAWIAQVRDQRAKAIPVRMLYGRNPQGMSQVLTWLAKRPPDPPVAGTWAVGGWAACHLHGTGFVTDLAERPVSLACLGPPGRLLEAWGLMRCDDARDAAFLLEPVRARLAISAAAGKRPPVVDAVQAAMGVASDPARGFEQAEHICNRIADAIEALP